MSGLESLCPGTTSLNFASCLLHTSCCKKCLLQSTKEQPCSLHRTCCNLHLKSVQSVIASFYLLDILTSVDIKDAYIHVTIFLPTQRHLHFVVGELHIQSVALPFGLAMLPGIFVKMLVPLLVLLQAQGIPILGYLVDLQKQSGDGIIATNGACSAELWHSSQNSTLEPLHTLKYPGHGPGTCVPSIGNSLNALVQAAGVMFLLSVPLFTFV